MLIIETVTGKKKRIKGVIEVVRSRKLNGESSLQLKVIDVSGQPASAAWKAIDTETKVFLQNEQYVIKNLSKKSVGAKSVKSADCVHTFFNDMINSVQYNQWSGSMTFVTALNRVFGPTNYTFVITGTFGAQAFDNFGKENCLSLFQKVLERYGAEFKVSGNVVYISDQVGAENTFRYQYKMNVKGAEETSDSNSLATVIRGYFGEPNDNGVYPIVREYPSPNIAIYGRKDADPFTDERVTDVATADRMLRQAIIDAPELSQTIELVELQDAGYTPRRPTPGDWGVMIYPPIDVAFKARIVEITETLRYINRQWQVVKTDVTLSNEKKALTDMTTRFERTAKDVKRIKEGTDKLLFSSLADGVKYATRAIQSAQTEVIFGDGIILQEKTNTNHLIALKSLGIGLSVDGGATYGVAMTAQGFVADYITTGTLRAILVEAVEIYGSYIEGTEIVGGEFFSATDVNSFTRIKEDYIESRGTYRRTWRGVTTTSNTSLRLENGLFRARNNTRNWSVYYGDFGISTYADGEGDSDASGTIEFHSNQYSPTGSYSGTTISSLAGRIALETDNARIYLNTGGASVFVGDMSDNLFPVVASAFNNSSSRRLKRDIVDLKDSGLDVVKQLRVREYKRLTKGEVTENDQWQAGFVLDELPDKLQNDESVDLYTLIGYCVKAIQEIDQKQQQLEVS